MSDHESLIVRYSAGRGKNLAKAKNKALPYSVFKEQFREPVRTGERFKEYLKLPHAEQVQLKGVNGWFFRSQIDGERRTRESARPTDIITLDFDYATPEFVETILSGDVLPGVLWFCHSSRRHTEEKPRLRFVIVLAEPLPNEAYGPISRIICKLIDPEMKMVDPVSFRPAQMMFMPTASKDGDYFFHESDGEPLDWYAEGEIFTQTVGDWHDYRVLPTAVNENLRAKVDKAEDPTTKKNIVGDFCRAYSVPEAIAKFLPDIYEPVDDHSNKPRYTYLKGSTTNGAVVEDDGLFLYSHHGSDPCADMLVNAYDLVRIHLFGDKDEKTDSDVPILQRPSAKAMAEMLEGDQEFIRAQVASRYDMTAMFEDADVDPDEDEDADGDADRGRATFESENDPDLDDLIADLVGVPAVTAPVPAVRLGTDLGYTPRKAGKRRKTPKKDWHLDLELSRTGEIVNTPSNVTRIVQNDVRINETMEYNEFTQEIVTRVPMRTKMTTLPLIPINDPVNGDLWEDKHTNVVRHMLSEANGDGKLGWGLKVAVQDVDAAIEMAALQCPFHPIKDKLLSVAWDGGARLHDLFPRYLGCEDNVYTRSVARLFFVAAVARVFEPGHKFDFVPILEGGQGKRKSTFIDVISLGYFGELTADMGDEKALVENMQGHLVMELPELSGLRRSDVETVKAFITRTESTVRLAYARRAKRYRRQCVFMGTTNEATYLLDRTGNRRWWPIKVEIDEIDTDALAREMPQVWAEAVEIYAAMRAAQPHGNLPLFLTDPEAKLIAEGVQESRVQTSESDIMAGKIADWLTRPLSESKFDESKERFYDEVCIPLIWSEALSENRTPTRVDSMHVGQALKLIGWFPSGTGRRFPSLGYQKTFIPTVGGAKVTGAEWVRAWEKTLIDITPEDLI